MEEATRFLKGESQNARQMYQRLMEQAAANLDYEQAAKFRNRLWALAHVTADQAINPEGIEEADVFAAYQEGGQTCIQVFFFRAGQNWGNRAYFPRADRSLPIEEVLESFIAQFYDDKPVPRLILLSHDLPGVDLLSEALSTKAERKVEVRAPKRGGKTGIVEHATQNAREALGRRLAESSSQRILLDGLRERFDLSVTPRRIEVFDNSHIQGSSAVGAMIVAGPDGFMKSHYRKFNIKSADLTPGDDYAMMREVLTRRFRRLALDEAQAPVFPSANPDGAKRAEGEQGFDPGSGAGALQEVPDHLGASASAFGMTGASTSRIEQPRPPSPQERGADALAFGMLRADANGDASEPEDAVIEEFPDRPDVVLIDGGRGQLSVAQEVLRELAIDHVVLIGVAKGPDRDAGREHFHRPGHDRSMMLEPRDPVLYFVQRLRDEAHRFAIGTHRAKRAKSIGVNPLDEIAGIGPSRKRALLKHFGSAKAVSRAGREDLQAVDGISAQMAQAIYDFFHERNE